MCKLSLESTTYDDTTQTVTIHLADAVSPGEILTVALPPVRNPTRAGVYLFTITAAPAGTRPRTQRIGTGRLYVFRPDSSRDLFGD